MRWRSPGISDAPQSEEGGSDNSPHPSSLSLPDVETAMSRESHLDNLVRGDVELEPRNLPVKPVIPIKIEGRMSPPRNASGKPATRSAQEIKTPAKRESSSKLEAA